MVVGNVLETPHTCVILLLSWSEDPILGSHVSLTLYEVHLY